MKLQRSKIAEMVLKKAKTRGFTLSDIKTNYQTIGIMAVLAKNRMQLLKRSIYFKAKSGNWCSDASPNEE